MYWARNSRSKAASILEFLRRRSRVHGGFHVRDAGGRLFRNRCEVTADGSAQISLQTVPSSRRGEIVEICEPGGGDLPVCSLPNQLRFHRRETVNHGDIP